MTTELTTKDYSEQTEIPLSTITKALREERKLPAVIEVKKTYQYYRLICDSELLEMLKNNVKEQPYKGTKLTRESLANRTKSLSR